MAPRTGRPLIRRPRSHSHSPPTLWRFRLEPVKVYLCLPSTLPLPNCAGAVSSVIQSQWWADRDNNPVDQTISQTGRAIFVVKITWGEEETKRRGERETVEHVEQEAVLEWVSRREYEGFETKLMRRETAEREEKERKEKEERVQAGIKKRGGKTRRGSGLRGVGRGYVGRPKGTKVVNNKLVYARKKREEGGGGGGGGGGEWMVEEGSGNNDEYDVGDGEEDSGNSVDEPVDGDEDSGNNAAAVQRGDGEFMDDGIEDEPEDSDVGLPSVEDPDSAGPIDEAEEWTAAKRSAYELVNAGPEDNSEDQEEAEEEAPNTMFIKPNPLYLHPQLGVHDAEVLRKRGKQLRDQNVRDAIAERREKQQRVTLQRQADKEKHQKRTKQHIALQSPLPGRNHAREEITRAASSSSESFTRYLSHKSSANMVVVSKGKKDEVPSANGSATSEFSATLPLRAESQQKRSAEEQSSGGKKMRLSRGPPTSAAESDAPAVEESEKEEEQGQDNDNDEDDETNEAIAESITGVRISEGKIQYRVRLVNRRAQHWIDVANLERAEGVPELIEDFHADSQISEKKVRKKLRHGAVNYGFRAAT